LLPPAAVAACSGASSASSSTAFTCISLPQDSGSGVEAVAQNALLQHGTISWSNNVTWI
jgi:hypothetical protein